MDDYIKREDAINAIGIRWGKKESPAKDIKRTIYRNLVAIHSADVAPVRHGRWIEHQGYCECDQCECLVTSYFNYCPNCGAKMDGEDNNE